MYTERKQMRIMIHQYKRELYNSTEKKGGGEAQLKSELNNYLFRGLINVINVNIQTERSTS